MFKKSGILNFDFVETSVHSPKSLATLHPVEKRFIGMATCPWLLHVYILIGHNEYSIFAKSQTNKIMKLIGTKFIA